MQKFTEAQIAVSTILSTRSKREFVSCASYSN